MQWLATFISPTWRIHRSDDALDQSSQMSQGMKAGYARIQADQCVPLAQIQIRKAPRNYLLLSLGVPVCGLSSCRNCGAVRLKCQQGKCTGHKIIVAQYASVCYILPAARSLPYAAQDFHKVKMHSGRCTCLCPEI